MFSELISWKLKTLTARKLRIGSIVGAFAEDDDCSLIVKNGTKKMSYLKENHHNITNERVS